MPKLDNIPTRTLTLPSSANTDDPIIVQVKDELLMGDIAELTLSDTPIDRTFVALAKFVASWNVTEDGTINSPGLPITPDNMRKLREQDFDFLTNVFNAAMNKAKLGLSTEEKKDSPSTLVDEPMEI